MAVWDGLKGNGRDKTQDADGCGEVLWTHIHLPSNSLESQSL